MSYSITDKTLALAGVFQAAHLVRQIADHGITNAIVLENSLETLFRMDAATTEDVFAGTPNVIDGLRFLVQQFENNPQKRDVSLTRLAISLLHLQKVLRKNHAISEQLASQLDALQATNQTLYVLDPDVVTALAKIYQSTVSQLSPKIMVKGHEIYLTDSENVSKIRASLLAGIRSAVLWGQVAGNRLFLILQRKAYVEEARRLIELV